MRNVDDSPNCCRSTPCTDASGIRAHCTPDDDTRFPAGVGRLARRSMPTKATAASSQATFVGGDHVGGDAVWRSSPRRTPELRRVKIKASVSLDAERQLVYHPQHFLGNRPGENSTPHHLAGESQHGFLNSDSPLCTLPPKRCRPTDQWRRDSARTTSRIPHLLGESSSHTRSPR